MLLPSWPCRRGVGGLVVPPPRRLAASSRLRGFNLVIQMIRRRLATLLSLTDDDVVQTRTAVPGTRWVFIAAGGAGGAVVVGSKISYSDGVPSRWTKDGRTAVAGAGGDNVVW